MRRQPATPISAVTDGNIVKIVGTVALAGESLRSPLTDLRCAAYTLELRASVARRPMQVRAGIGQSRRVQDEGVVAFRVRDATGEALVRVHGLTALALRRHHFARDNNMAIDGELHAYLQRKGHDLSDEWEAVEGVLEEGARVAVMGLAHWEPDAAAQPSYRESPMLLVIAAGDAPLDISNESAAL